VSIKIFVFVLTIYMPRVFICQIDIQAKTTKSYFIFIQKSLFLKIIFANLQRF